MVKFALVGSIGMVVDFSFTYLMKEWLFFNAYVATGIGFSIASVSNYYINSYWTFNSSVPLLLRKFILFVGISTFGLGINISMIFIFQYLGVPFYISKLMAISFVFFWNYILNRSVTFRLVS